MGIRYHIPFWQVSFTTELGNETNVRAVVDIANFKVADGNRIVQTAKALSGVGNGSSVHHARIY